MEVGILGPLELRVGDALVPVRRGRPRSLLAALLLSANQPVPSDVLIEHLWGHELPDHPANALQTVVSHLRKVLAAAAGDDGAAGRPAIETVEGGYRLAVQPEAVDAVRFGRLVERGRDLLRGGRPADAVAALDEALALWRGPALADVAYEAFAQAEIARLDELRLSAFELRIDGLLAMGRHAEVVGLARQLVADHPLRERLCAQLMLALYRCGRQAEALEAYEATRTRLAEDLGIDPGPELQQLLQAVLRQDRSLAAPERPDPVAATSATPVEAGLPPAALTPLIGREEEARRLGALLADHRLLTLTGPGGTGKTRLAVHLTGEGAPPAALLAWVDLGAVFDPEFVPFTVATAVGAAPAPDRDPADAVVAALAGREGLLVLDTCEHVVPACAALVERILRAAPRVRVLATSRRPLGVGGELVWPVAPLSLPDPGDLATAPSSDAVRLFCERAAAVRPGFALTEGNAEQVARICLLLDGLPLAIELAAAHADVLSPARILALLDDRFSLLVGRGGGTTQRQQGLRTTIDWSYGLLSEGERQLLDRLAVFAGSFSLDAAIDVGGSGDPEDLQALLALARQSLVTVAGEDRYRLLDTVRAYASERLAERPQEHVEVAARHARWCARQAQSAEGHLSSAEQVRWLEELRPDVPNHRAALEWCFGEGGDSELGVALAAALAWFWAIDGMFAEGRRWLDAALQVEQPDSRLRAKVLIGLGVHAASLGELAAATAHCEQAVELFRDAGDIGGEAQALLYLGVAHWGAGDYPAAAADHDAAVDRFRTAGRDWGVGVSLSLRARTARDLGDDATAAALLEEALPIARRAGDRHIVALCLEQQARIRLQAGDPAAAEQLARESLALDEAVGYTEGQVAALNVLGMAALAGGDAAAAHARHARALSTATRINHPGGIAESLECLAAARAAEGRHAEAAEHLGAAAAQRAAAGLALPPTSARLVSPVVEAVRAALGEQAWRRATRRGSGLGPGASPELAAAR